MNWNTIIKELQDESLTLEAIGTAVGLKKNSVHDLLSGKAKTTSYEAGCKLVDLHRKVMRKKQRKVTP